MEGRKTQHRDHVVWILRKDREKLRKEAELGGGLQRS
jgi:hypothetical protein